jgi:hypothetical protein
VNPGSLERPEALLIAQEVIQTEDLVTVGAWRHFADAITHDPSGA